MPHDWVSCVSYGMLNDNKSQTLPLHINRVRDTDAGPSQESKIRKSYLEAKGITKCSLYSTPPFGLRDVTKSLMFCNDTVSCLPAAPLSRQDLQWRDQAQPSPPVSQAQRKEKVTSTEIQVRILVEVVRFVTDVVLRVGII